MTYTNLSIAPVLLLITVEELYQKDHHCHHLLLEFQAPDKTDDPRTDEDLISNTSHHGSLNCMLVLPFQLEHIVLMRKKMVLMMYFKFMSQTRNVILTNSMHKQFRFGRKGVINNNIQLWDIYTTCSYISDDESSYTASLKFTSVYFSSCWIQIRVDECI